MNIFECGFHYILGKNHKFMFVQVLHQVMVTFLTTSYQTDGLEEVGRLHGYQDHYPPALTLFCGQGRRAIQAVQAQPITQFRRLEAQLTPYTIYFS